MDRNYESNSGGGLLISKKTEPKKAFGVCVILLEYEFKKTIAKGP